MTEKMKCPLCTGAATAAPLGGNQARYYTCERCTEFVITRTAENWMRQSAGPDRKACYSELARRSNDAMLLKIRRKPEGPALPIEVEAVLLPRRDALMV